MNKRCAAQVKVFAIIILLSLLLISCAEGENSETNVSVLTSEEVSANESDESSTVSKSEENYDAVYLGVYGFGTDSLTADSKNSFKYVFEINGTKKFFSMDNGVKSSDGTYSYDIQNTLKRGYTYTITVKNKKVIKAEEVSEAINADGKFTPVVSAQAGEKTISNLLSTAMMPVGTSLYIYGGGWDWQDVGASVEASSIGVAESWVKFFNEQNSSFTYINSADKENSYFPHGMWNEYYYAGLDCSGYVGWVIYNVVNTESGKEGYVLSASKMAKYFASKGWGSFSKQIGSTMEDAKGDLLPGDIVSKSGHVWICLGTCEDGSVVIAHSSPTKSRTGQEGGGVQIGALGESEDCEAYKLADYYMKTYFSKWYARYPATLKNFYEYTDFSSGDTGIFSWRTSGTNAFLSDPEGIRSMTAKEVLEFIFKDAKKS